MKVVFEPRFLRDYASLPSAIQRQTDRQIKRLLENPRYPSMRIKKMEGQEHIWEARVTKNYRFTFQVKEDTLVLRRIGTHDILRTP